jgi:hypothetical protein
LPWRGPEYEGEFPSLGWDVYDWAREFLRVPDGPFAGDRLELTDEQLAILVRFYGLDDRGRWLWRRAAVRRAQGWGKSPLLGLVALAELAGPSRFAGWDASGEPVSRRPSAPWVQVAAVSEDQTDNTYAALYEMARESDLAGSVLDIGITRIYLADGPGRLEPVTSAAGSRLGQRITFAVLDETHLWTRQNGGHKLAATIRRNAGKMNGRTFESTNAHRPGEDSVAERTWKASVEAAAGLLYDSVEAPAVDDLSDRDAVVKALHVAYGDSRWVDLTRIADEIADPGTDPDDARRFYFNQLVAGTDRLDVTRWAELADPARVVPAGEYVALGFDGSISDDATVLWGCTPDFHLFELAVWERPADAPKDWRVPRLEVHEAVARAFDRYNVGLMYCDPAKWWTEIEQWADEFGDETVVMFDTNSSRRFAPACGRFTTMLAEGLLSHDGSGLLAAHLAHTSKKFVRTTADPTDPRSKFVFVKGPERLKIDATVAAVLAVEAAANMPALAVHPEPVVWFS